MIEPGDRPDHDRDAALIRALDAGTPEGWREPGFVRPLAGLWLYVSALVVLLGPYLYVTALLVPSRVQPFPQVDGAAATIDELVLLGWALLDFGMTSAVVRTVAALRRTRPERLLPHLRLLLRWQLGVVVALTLVAGMAASMIPAAQPLLRRALWLRACTAPLLLFATLPAIFEALQRYDRQLLLELLDKRFLAILLPIPCVLLARRLEVDAPVAALGGLVLGQALASLGTGLVGLGLLRRLGLPLRALAGGALPDRDERAALYRFGVGVMAAKAIFFVAGAAELTLVIARLPDFARWLGVKQILMARLLLPLWLLWPFCESAVPTLSDALAAGQPGLARATIARYVQHGHLFVGTLFAVVVGGGPSLVRALLPPAWHAAASLLPLAGLTGLLLPLTWIADAAQRAHGESGRNAGYVLGEQVLRLILIALSLARFGLAGLFAASAIAASAKTAAVLYDVHRRRLPLSLPARVVFVGPLLAAFAVAACARGLVSVALSLPVAAVAWAGPGALALATALAFPTALFTAGLVGALDAEALRELDQALAIAPLPGALRAPARWVAAAAHLGARQRLKADETI